MLRQFVLSNTDRYLARWVVLLFDLFVVGIGYFAATALRFNFELEEIAKYLNGNAYAAVMIFYLFGFYLTRSYAGIIRHTNLQDAYNIIRGSFIGFGILFFLGLVIPPQLSFLSSLFSQARSILVIHFLITSFSLVGSRLVIKLLYNRVLSTKDVKVTRVLIYGAGVSGMITKNTLLQESSREYEIQGFVDDNSYKIGKAIEGIMVYSSGKIFRSNFISKNKTDQLIISIQSNLAPSKKKEIVEAALEKNLEVKIVPPVSSWIHGELSAKQIKSVKIEELLERDPIVLDNVNISREIRHKVVMVTGAAGSIGSEISRQLLHYSPKQVILLDQAESALYELDCEIRQDYTALADKATFVIGDVSDEKRMRKAFKAYNPDIVFHAAAYKHVPLMEDNPYESVNVNVHGTKITADLSVEFGVEKFVMVSTDKAVNPTNVMGATKRTAEIYTQSLGRKRGVKTQFIITRFGNVLGSNGSVIPLFRKQIEKGGPVTITHKEITRYFMTIPEACNLVLEAGSMGKGGEIFVFDMGESVRIYDLARKMVKLSGLTLGRDIEIVEVGLRPGEKLYEELLAVKENTKQTHHPKILIAQVEAYDYALVQKGVKNLVGCLGNCDNIEIVGKLKLLVPEFISNNSIFASLDLKKIVNE